MDEHEDERPGEVDDAGPVTGAADAADDDADVPGTSAPSIAFRSGG